MRLQSRAEEGETVVKAGGPDERDIGFQLDRGMRREDICGVDVAGQCLFGVLLGNEFGDAIVEREDGRGNRACAIGIYLVQGGAFCAFAVAGRV